MNDSPKMEMKDHIDIILKEYDALRKEIDDRLNAPKLYFVPLLFIFVGGVLGWKADAPLDLILLFIVPVLLTFLSIAMNAGYYIHRAGERIARIEDKVFKLSSLPLLTHETETIVERKRLPLWVSIAGGVILATFYVITETVLFAKLQIQASSQLDSHPGRPLILILLLTLPLLVFTVSGIRLTAAHHKILSFRSALLSELDSKGVENLLDSLSVLQKATDGKASTTKTKKS